MNPTHRAHRLHVEAPLAANREIELREAPAHYLSAVLRLKPGDPVRLFNATDGEWLCFVAQSAKRALILRCERLVAETMVPPDLDYLFAPLKAARLDYVVQKATELGVRRLRSVITERTVAERVNLERMRANAIEAAEQCNLVFVPEVIAPERLDRVLADWDATRLLIHADETASVADPLAALNRARLPAAVLIGPEGGFAPAEIDLIRSLPAARAISLGPRILRADTAAVAALSLVQAVCGDWRGHQSD